MKFYTVRELEEKTGENIEEVLQDFIQSCNRTGNFNQEENIKYFIRENAIKNSEYDFLFNLYSQIEGE